VDRRALDRRAREQLATIGVSMDVSQPMRALSTAQEQLVQIAAAVGTGARVLLFDEPTSSLSGTDAEHLFQLIGRLREAGVTMIYVSHRIPEVLRLCDRVHVLRDGAHVGSLDGEAADEASLVRLMIGRDLEQLEPRHLEREPGEVLLEVRGLSSPEGFEDIDLDVRAGEIVGLAGLVGAGRSALTRALFGLDGAARGSVRVCGRRLRLGSVRSAVDAGLGLVPEDRKRQGLVLGMGIVANQSLGAVQRHRRHLLLDRRAEWDHAAQALARVEVNAPSLAAPVGELSGGNQQKVVLSRWLDREARVLIVDEPTRGVDVGAKAAIHALLDDVACSGAGVLLVSSELPEVLGLSTRVGVLREGRLVEMLSRADATPDRVLSAMAGSAPAALSS
jgi:ABC-type sugar transport system ATPase subunit